MVAKFLAAMAVGLFSALVRCAGRPCCEQSPAASHHPGRGNELFVGRLGNRGHQPVGAFSLGHRNDLA